MTISGSIARMTGNDVLKRPGGSLHLLLHNDWQDKMHHYQAVRGTSNECDGRVSCSLSQLCPIHHGHA